MAEAIPWHEAERLYVRKFPSKTGTPALTVRMMLGSLWTCNKKELSNLSRWGRLPASII